MDYTQAIADLTSKNKFYINLGLERISQVLDLLGNPQDKLRCIQVAGTNGKGSVCTMLAAILCEQGYKTGLYTSPHIFDYTERIKINDQQITQNQFSNYYENITRIADEHNIKLTEFEIITAIMYTYFADNKIDIAIIETGLGGRYDATNILKTNLCAVITHIDLDHTDRLGNTKGEIAFEKAGIIKPDSIIITNEPYSEIKNQAKKMNARLIKAIKPPEKDFINSLTLKGEHQKDNLSLVLKVTELLFPEINKTTILNGLKKVHNPCRFQYLSKFNLLIDGAHNPNCFSALRKNLSEYYPNQKHNYVFGCLKTKDYPQMLKIITTDPLLNKLFIYSFNNKNACSFDDIKKACPINCENIDSIDNLINNEVLTVICGSFYMINELLDEKFKNNIL